MGVICCSSKNSESFERITTENHIVKNFGGLICGGDLQLSNISNHNARVAFSPGTQIKIYILTSKLLPSVSLELLTDED